jgi:hypothetical protein
MPILTPPTAHPHPRTPVAAEQKDLLTRLSGSMVSGSVEAVDVEAVDVDAADVDVDVETGRVETLDVREEERLEPLMQARALASVFSVLCAPASAFSVLPTQPTMCSYWLLSPGVYCRRCGR